MNRKIIHCDADCFYAAVEMRDEPSLRGRPIAIGGTRGRGVVATASYEARGYGVRSAMPVSEALRLCPHLELLPTDMPRYRAVSRKMMDIFRDYTALVEPLSLDEAYLDVTESPRCQGSATLMAREIRQRVREELGITVSAGVAPNKFVAKVASDWEKPDGLCVVTPEEVDGFVRRLAVEKLFGVGGKTAARLHGLGIYTCEDLRQWSEPALRERFGRQGARLFEMARGRDERRVTPSRVRKSVSVESTYSENLESLAQCRKALHALVEQLQARLNSKGHARGRGAPIGKVFVKLRFADFSTHTRESTHQRGVVPEVGDFLPLLEHLYGDEPRPVRLIGLGVRFAEFDPVASRQLSLFDESGDGA